MDELFVCDENGREENRGGGLRTLTDCWTLCVLSRKEGASRKDNKVDTADDVDVEEEKVSVASVLGVENSK